MWSFFPAAGVVDGVGAESRPEVDPLLEKPAAAGLALRGLGGSLRRRSRDGLAGYQGAFVPGQSLPKESLTPASSRVLLPQRGRPALSEIACAIVVGQVE